MVCLFFFSFCRSLPLLIFLAFGLIILKNLIDKNVKKPSKIIVNKCHVRLIVGMYIKLVRFLNLNKNN